MEVLQKKQDQLVGRRVLLIEDDEVDSLMLKFMVESEGGLVSQEGSCDHAYEVIKKRDFDLLILDTRLQQTNTLQMIRDLRASAGFDLPVIGLASRHLSGRGINSGFDAMIIRPIDQSKFRQALAIVAPKLP